MGGLIGPGARIDGRYAVLEELGRGGMGVVFLAHDDVTDRDVAVKVLREAPEGEAARRLRREARAMSDLDPKGVAQVYEVGETPDGELYLVMEYVRGRTLRSLARAGRIERSEALRILRSLATTLGQAHRLGLVHRDVKPDNVMVGDAGRVVLLDFGIVKRMAVGEETANLSTQLTAEGSVIGTPAYLSPEQALGREIGPKTDQFALAVIAYELLSGRLPWTATEMTTMLAQVLAETPRAPSSVDTKLTAAFDSVLARGLAKNPAARFAAIEELADALEAAERGDYVPMDVVETVAGPAARRDGGVGLSAKRGPRAAAWFGAALVLAALGGTVAMRRRSAVSAPKGSSTSSASLDSTIAGLRGPDARLACPILDVQGVTDVAVRLGAAAATVVCARASWLLGGANERVFPPAALFDVPREPFPSFPDPYATPEQRERSIALAQTRGTAYVDGVVTREAEQWRIELVVKARDGQEIRRADGHDGRFSTAVAKAMSALWKAPLSARPIDPAVARWTSYPDAETGIAVVDMTLSGSAAGCSRVRDSAIPFGASALLLRTLCEANGESVAWDAGVPRLDDSTPEALAASAKGVLAFGGTLLSLEERRKLAARLDDLRAHESSKIGRVALGEAAFTAWTSAKEPQRAHAAALLVVREDPLVIDAWQSIVANARDSVDATAPVAAAWFPSETSFLTKAGSHRGDELETRLKQARLAYLVEPGLVNAAHLGRALAEAGRTEEVRSLAATPLDDPTETRTVAVLLAAFVDLHVAKFAAAITQLEEAGNTGMSDLILASDVAGEGPQVATRWATHFLSLPEDQVALTARGYDSPMVLCMRARRDLAVRCLDRIAKVGHAETNWWGEGGEELLQGAQRYARGDLRGAASIWRPLVAGTNEEIFRILPTEAFEQAGQPELAARLDARKLPYTGIAGVSDAAPREAHRALAAGDKARAKTLAESVVTAWEVADVEVPAVSDMRALLRALHD